VESAGLSESGAAMSAPVLNAIADRADSLTERVFDMIRDAIVSRAIPPGSSLTEASLAAQLNVSKTPVRESLIRLREIGLLEPDGRRLRVITPTRNGLRAAYEFRLCLEPVSAQYAARRASRRQADAISALAQETLTSAESGDTARNSAAARSFHLQIVEASGNELLRNAVNHGLILTQTLMRRDFSTLINRPARAHQHIEIARAIIEGDEDGAAKAMAAHTNFLLESALAAFKPE
jgi:DNA-binding GntR family transcriptional regulator